MTTPAPMPPGPAPTPKPGWRLPLLLVGGMVAAVLLVGLALFVIGSAAGGGRSPEDTAQAYIQGYHDNDKSAVYDLIAPAQRRQIDQDVWEECGYDRLDQTDEGTDPDDPEAEMEVVYIEDEDDAYTNHVPGDGERQYPAVSAVVRATSADDEWREFELDLVKDGDDWFIRLSQQGGTNSEWAEAQAPCE